MTFKLISINEYPKYLYNKCAWVKIALNSFI